MLNMHKILKLGALVGLYEAIAIVRWDWLMSDPRGWRVALGVGYGLWIIVINMGLFTLLGAILKRCTILTPVIYAALVYGARYVGEDRFETASYMAIGLIIVSIGLSRLWPWALSLLAIALATPGLWGRVPVYTTAIDEQLCFLLPGAIATLLAGLIIDGRRVSGKVYMGAGLVAVVGLAGLFVQKTGLNTGHSDKPNVLFVLVDTLRQDHVQPYGEATPTPGLQRLSEEGTRYADAITVIPKTTQSVAAFQTGKYPVSNGVRVLKDSLRAEEQTLAETLKAAGYSTAAFVHNGWVMRGRGFEQGFDQFHSFFELERAWGVARLSGWVMAIDTFTTKRIRPFDGNTNAAVATDAAIDWMQNVPQPFYGYVHYFDPHWPYRPPGENGECKVNNIRKVKKVSRGKMMFKNPLKKSDNNKACALYRKEVTYNTDQVGRLLASLDEMGIADNTIVVFTADHGHSLGEHNYWYHHGEFLYEPSMAIPLFIKAPGQLQAGAVVKDQVRSIDVMPTLLALTGVDTPKMDGVDLSTHRAGPAFIETDISYFKSNKRRYIKGVTGKLRGVRTPEWKLILSPKKGGGKWELYNLKKDPKELKNLIKSRKAPKAIVLALMNEMKKWIPEAERLALADLGHQFDRLPGKHKRASKNEKQNEEIDATSDEELSDAERKMLQALGYIE